jgi:hypothetical protein
MVLLLDGDMNERMLELYRRAQVPDTAIDPSNNMPYETTRFSADKFAELIVRECAQVCLEQRDPGNLNYKPSVKFAEAVKQHFGVQE